MQTSDIVMDIGIAFSGSEIVGPAELSKREDENKKGGNSLPFPLCRLANFSSAFYFRVFPTIWEPGTG